MKQVASKPQLAATIECQVGWTAIYLTQIDAVDQRAAALLACIDREIANWSVGPASIALHEGAETWWIAERASKCLVLGQLTALGLS